MDTKKIKGILNKVIATPWLLAASLAGLLAVGTGGLVTILLLLAMLFGPSAGSGYQVDPYGYPITQNGNGAYHQTPGFHRLPGGGFTTDDGGFRTRHGWSSGTFDPSGGGNHVISSHGEVLNLPPY